MVSLCGNFFEYGHVSLLAGSALESSYQMLVNSNFAGINSERWLTVGASIREL